MEPSKNEGFMHVSGASKLQVCSSEILGLPSPGNKLEFPWELADFTIGHP